MAVKLRGGGNSSLLEMDYSNPNVIKNLLKNWSGMQAMSLRGDRVATCVLTDLELVTGITLDEFDKKHLDRFLSKRNKDVLTEAQFVAVVFVLVLGYSQPEVAFIFGVSQQSIGKNINYGCKRISSALEEGYR